MKTDKNGLYFSNGCFIAACLAVSAVLTAFVSLQMDLDLRWGHVAFAAILFIVGASAVGLLLHIGAWAYEYFVEYEGGSRSRKILFWCVYLAVLFGLMMLIIGYALE